MPKTYPDWKKPYLISKKPAIRVRKALIAQLLWNAGDVSGLEVSSFESFYMKHLLKMEISHSYELGGRFDAPGKMNLVFLYLRIFNR